MRVLPLLCVAPALVAQPPAPSLDAAVKAQKPEIEKLMQTDPQAAYAKAQALVPAAVPVFDKTSIQTVMKGRAEATAHFESLFLLGRTARVAGELEKSKEAYSQAVDIAKAAKADTYAGLKPAMDQWKAAEEKAKAALEEGKAKLAELSAKPADQLTPEEAQQMKNFKIHQNNAAQAPKVVEQLQAAVNEWDTFVKAAQTNGETLDKRLKEEAEDRAKPAFKGSVSRYASQVVKDVKPIQDKEQLFSIYYRLLKLDPANKEVQHRLDVLMGKAVDKPEPAKKGGKKKGK